MVIGFIGHVAKAAVADLGLRKSAIGRRSAALSPVRVAMVEVQAGRGPGSHVVVSRRDALRVALHTVVAFGFLLGPMSIMRTPPVNAESKPRVKSLEEYRAQIDAGYDVMLDLQEHWNERTKAFDGDIVRRYLGTVGKTSPLFNLKKAFAAVWKSLADREDVSDADLEELNEKYNLVLDGISGVDFQLYSVNFSELVPTKAKLIEDGKVALDKTAGLYKEVLAILAKY